MRVEIQVQLGSTVNIGKDTMRSTNHLEKLIGLAPDSSLDLHVQGSYMNPISKSASSTASGITLAGSKGARLGCVLWMR